jgi:hypothetical protein
VLCSSTYYEKEDASPAPTLSSRLVSSKESLVDTAQENLSAQRKNACKGLNTLSHGSKDILRLFRWLAITNDTEKMQSVDTVSGE